MSDSSITLTSSDSEEEIPRIRFIRDRNDVFQTFDEQEFKDRFRFSKLTIMELLNLFGNQIEPATFRNKSISSKDQLLITLRFLATGSFQQVIGDHINIHKSTVSRIVRRVIKCIASLKPRYIKMPDNDTLTSTKQRFFAIRGLPRVLGAIDCTHIKIQSPGGHNAELFRNRKGYFSINVQIVCDARLNIMNIIARWPGSTHDSTIFNDSPLCADLENGQYANSFLLGDSGYPCRTYLLTPFLRPSTPAEVAYNFAHCATRNVVERCFGILKRRFPCLSLGLRNLIPTTLNIIVACAVLHNIGLNDDMFEFPDVDDNAEDIHEQLFHDI